MFVDNELISDVKFSICCVCCPTVSANPATVDVSGVYHSISPLAFLRGCWFVVASANPLIETVPSDTTIDFPSPNTDVPTAFNVLSGCITYNVASVDVTTTRFSPIKYVPSELPTSTALYAAVVASAKVLK